MYICNLSNIKLPILHPNYMSFALPADPSVGVNVRSHTTAEHKRVYALCCICAIRHPCDRITWGCGTGGAV